MIKKTIISTVFRSELEYKHTFVTSFLQLSLLTHCTFLIYHKPQTHAILVDIHEFNIFVVGTWHSVIHCNCQITFESMVYFHELFFFHSYYSLGYLTIIQCSVVLTFETPEKEWRKMFWMTVKRASRTKNFVIAEEQHVNIDYIYCVTSFFRKERRENPRREVIVLSIRSFQFPSSNIFSKKENVERTKRQGKAVVSMKLFSGKLIITYLELRGFQQHKSCAETTY